MIERATANDIPVLVKLKIEMFRESDHLDLLIENPEQIIIKKYKELYAADNACHFVIRDGSIIVACAGGFIKADIPYCFFKTPFYGFIGDVYTTPAHRNKGYAMLLSKQIIEWLSSKGITEIRLLASLQARKMYEKLGFTGTDEMGFAI